jgi:hypothetical protein
MLKTISILGFFFFFPHTKEFVKENYWNFINFEDCILTNNIISVEYVCV